MNIEPSIILIFFSGILSFLSPCILSIIPGNLAYISGVGVNEVNNWKVKFKVLANTVFFVLGFSSVYFLIQIIGIFFINFAANFIEREIIFKLAGVLIIFLGLNMIGIITFDFLFNEKRIKSTVKSKNIFISLFSGVLFGISWSPCIGPLLYSIITYISEVKTIEKGMFYITIYCLAMGIPFLLTGFFMNFAITLFKKISKFEKAIETTAGIILLIIGISLFFNKSGIITSVFS